MSNVIVNYVAVPVDFYETHQEEVEALQEENEELKEQNRLYSILNYVLWAASPVCLVIGLYLGGVK